MKKKFHFLIHLVYWFYMINQLLYPWYINKTESHFWPSLALELVLVLITFYAFYFTIALLIRKKNLFLGILAAVSLLLVFSTLRYFVELYFWKEIIPLPPKEMINPQELFFAGLRISIITGAYSLLIRFAIDWVDSQKQKAEMINQTQTAELALLRSQVNPHFLFNTLNNIYSLVIKQSPEGPEAIMKLSSIMRYTLYDTNADRVPLEKEIEYMISFIELQKLRVRHQNFVDFTTEGEVENKTIAPMLLIPFVENAFKHGSKSGSLPGIRIRLVVSSTGLSFEVSNSMKRNTLKPKDSIGGIGLQNIKRRLEILYPGNHLLEIHEEDDLYSIKLILRNL